MVSLSRCNSSPAATAGRSNSPMAAKMAAVPHQSPMAPARIAARVVDRYASY